MPVFHSLTFYITGLSGRLLPDNPIWCQSLIGNAPFSQGGCRGGATSPCTVGEYLTAAEVFICSPKVADRILQSLAEDGCDCGPKDLSVSLALQKHGAFYHPVKVTVERPGHAVQTFALNGAVTERGRRLAEREWVLLSLFEKEFSKPPTPRVYAQETLKLPFGEVGFLLTRWFEGYYEFHMTRASGDSRIVVWRPESSDLFLAPSQVHALYRNIARILTRSYSPLTGEQISAWHHAAGDFITDPTHKDLPVRLITLRRYERIMDGDLLTAGILPGLLFFFVDLCFRMQLDRLDGVGESVFLGPDVLSATAAGFWDIIGETLGDKTCYDFHAFFRQFNQDQVLNLLLEVLAVSPPAPSERDLIGEKLLLFSAQIRELFNSECFSDFY